MRKLFQYILVYSDPSVCILNISDLYDEGPSGCGLFAISSVLAMANPMVLTRSCLEIRYGVSNAKAHSAHMWQGPCQGMIAIPAVALTSLTSRPQKNYVIPATGAGEIAYMTNSLSFLTKLTCRCIAVCLMDHMQHVGEATSLLVFEVAFAVADADSDVYDFFRVTEFHLDQISSIVREQILGASEIPITCSDIRTYPAFNDGYIDDLPWTTREIAKN
ncbi:hypothetical protein LA080_015926 [Diaporthe eres]|nr:hypothetical protein LA080_015926 [Diaporthe eres]